MYVCLSKESESESDDESSSLGDGSLDSNGEYSTWPTKVTDQLRAEEKELEDRNTADYWTRVGATFDYSSAPMALVV